MVEYLNSFSLKKTNKEWQDTLRYFCIKPQATKRKQLAVIHRKKKKKRKKERSFQPIIDRKKYFCFTKSFYGTAEKLTAQQHILLYIKLFYSAVYFEVCRGDMNHLLKQQNTENYFMDTVLK